MEWNRPPKKIVSPAPVVDICFKSTVYDSQKSTSAATARSQPPDKSRLKFDPRPTADRTLHEEKLQSLRKHVREHFPESGFLTFWDDDDSDDGDQLLAKRHCKESLEEALAGTVLEPLVFFWPSMLSNSPARSGEEVEVALEQCTAFAAEQVLEVDVAARVERSTRGQADNEIWLLLRNGRLNKFTIWGRFSIAGTLPPPTTW